MDKYHYICVWNIALYIQIYVDTQYYIKKYHIFLFIKLGNNLRFTS